LSILNEVILGDATAQNIITLELGTDYLFPRAVQVASQAHLARPGQMAMAQDGSILIALPAVNVVARLRIPENQLSIFAGNGIRGFSGDGGPAIQASLFQPAGVAVGPSGSVYISDTGNNRVRVVSPGGVITTLIGPGVGLINVGPLTTPVGLAVDQSENVYVAVSGDTEVYRVTPSGVATIVAGDGSTGFFGSIPPGTLATAYNLVYPQGVFVASNGDLLIADVDSIYRVDSTGVLTLVAGHNGRGFSGDGGPAVNAQLSGASSLAMDTAGNILFTDTSNNRVRRISTSGIIETVVGSGQQYGPIGDGGSATTASLNTPAGIIFGSAQEFV
jgi:hypothetical protein